MDDYSRLHIFILRKLIFERIMASCPPLVAVLLHSLQVEAGIEAEIVHFLNWGYIMIWEWESTEGARCYCSLVIGVTLFSAKIVHFDHSAVKNSEKAHQIFLFVTVEALYALSGETTRNNSVCNVRQI